MTKRSNIFSIKKPRIFGHIELIVYDFDGVMTDNRAFVFENKIEAVIVNRSDGLGVNMIKEMGIPQIVLSTESNPVVNVRAEKLGIPSINNCKDKKLKLQEYCLNNGVSAANVLYVGNDVNDLEVMKNVGMPVAPSDAHKKIKKVAKCVLRTKGGDGVVRELADLLLKRH